MCLGKGNRILRLGSMRLPVHLFAEEGTWKLFSLPPSELESVGHRSTNSFEQALRFK